MRRKNGDRLCIEKSVGQPGTLEEADLVGEEGLACDLDEELWEIRAKVDKDKSEIGLLYEGQAVTFDVEKTKRGLRALNIALA